MQSAVNSKIGYLLISDGPDQIKYRIATRQTVLLVFTHTLIFFYATYYFNAVGHFQQEAHCGTIENPQPIFFLAFNRGEKPDLKVCTHTNGSNELTASSVSLGWNSRVRSRITVSIFSSLGSFTLCSVFSSVKS